jgi:predicted amidohydrolase YtcJ
MHPWAARDPLIQENPQVKVSSHLLRRTYTAWAARQLFLENKIGSIEPGKEADIAVWDKDMYTIPAAELHDLKCEMTIYNGEVVYRAKNTPVTGQ